MTRRRLAAIMLGLALAGGLGLWLLRAAPPPPQPVRLAWFYKPPASGDLLPVRRAAVVILTRRDEEVRDRVRQQGYAGPLLQYLRLDAIHDPGSCGAQPNRNQVADQPGDSCLLLASHPEWFLRDSGGQVIAHNSYLLMDPGNAGWRAFWLARARASQEQFGWKGVFLDNIEASLAKREDRGAAPALYPDDASYLLAVRGFVDYLRSAYFQPAGRPLYGNIVAVRDLAGWTQIQRLLDGVMVERFAVGWGEDWLDRAEWEQWMEILEDPGRAASATILVAQGAQGAADRQQFALASYLLIANERTAFRYAHHEAYDQFWDYPNYQLDLGQPLGPRFREGAWWRREFSNGSVLVDPGSHLARILLNP